MSRPSDHYDAPEQAGIKNPRLGFLGTLRSIWRMLTSMRTALGLLLLLALAAIPGSIFPQRGSDPNGVTQYFQEHKDIASTLDNLKLFDVYSSPWFAAVYLLLFISLIGCIIPRTRFHLRAMRQPPPRTPANLRRLPAYRRVRMAGVDAEKVPNIIAAAQKQLRRRGFRTAVIGGRNGASSVSAERGYLRETGNLVFHASLVAVLVTIAVGSGFIWHGQRILVEGTTFVNDQGSYSSFSPGTWFSDSQLTPYSLELDKLHVSYETNNTNAIGQPIDYTADMKATIPSENVTSRPETLRVNEPLKLAGTDVYLLGNGYAPTVIVRDPQGKEVYRDSVPFLAQSPTMTSLGVVKVPDGLAKQVGLLGFFYPTASKLENGTFTSSYPDLRDPMLSLNVYTGDLGIDSGQATSVYSLDVDKMTQLTGGKTGKKAVELKPGQTAELPDGLGSIEFVGAPRYASLDVHHDPTQGWLLGFVTLVVAGLATSLFVPRRRAWVRATPNDDGSVSIEYAALARGDDPNLDRFVKELARDHAGRAEARRVEGARAHRDAEVNTKRRRVDE